VASRGFTRPKYRRGLYSKLGGGLQRRQGLQSCIWIHAVSVGEVITALPLIQALKERHGDWDLRVSVSTFTGFEVARKHLGEVPVFYLPLDLSPVVLRFFRALRPTAVILLELEVWPNFLIQAARLGVPVFVANGRITERSSGRYAVGGALTRSVFSLVTSFAVQNRDYLERFLRLGVDSQNVEVLGNLKHDREPAPVARSAAELRAALGWASGETRVLVGGSTHPEEERILCRIYTEIKRRGGKVRLVLVPRHVERLDSRELASWRAGEPLERWTRVRGAVGAATGALEGPGILVVDTVGELETFYSMADLVFVGGSLIPHGGQNLFEPARLRKAIVFGPHVENFSQESALLLAAGAAIRVADEAELQVVVDRLLRNPIERQQLAVNALKVANTLRGATQRHVQWLETQLRLYSDRGAC
jgi:3-deoxy-D-manno-octulosonic-acid transferase